MKYLCFLLLLILSCLSSCKSTDRKATVPLNQPIEDYLKTLVPKDSVIYIHENKLPCARAIRTMETGSMPDPVFEKYAVNFLESEYYKKDAWDVLTKRFANDTTRGKWITSDFKIPHRMITGAYQKELFKDPKLHEKEIIDIIKNPKKIFIFSGVMYYDDNRYAIFSMTISYNIILCGPYADELIIMEKRGKKWVYVDKMLNDAFINP